MNGIDFNFNKERSGEYPIDMESVLNASNEQIMEWINTLPAPTNHTEFSLFNEVLNQFHIRGGRA